MCVCLCCAFFLAKYGTGFYIDNGGTVFYIENGGRKKPLGTAGHKVWLSLPAWWSSQIAAFMSFKYCHKYKAQVAPGSSKYPNKTSFVISC